MTKTSPTGGEILLDILIGIVVPNYINSIHCRGKGVHRWHSQKQDLI